MRKCRMCGGGFLPPTSRSWGRTCGSCAHNQTKGKDLQAFREERAERLARWARQDAESDARTQEAFDRMRRHREEAQGAV